MANVPTTKLHDLLTAALDIARMGSNPALTEQIERTLEAVESEVIDEDETEDRAERITRNVCGPDGGT